MCMFAKGWACFGIPYFLCSHFSLFKKKKKKIVDHKLLKEIIWFSLYFDQQRFTSAVLILLMILTRESLM